MSKARQLIQERALQQVPAATKTEHGWGLFEQPPVEPSKDEAPAPEGPNKETLRKLDAFCADIRRLAGGFPDKVDRFTDTAGLFHDLSMVADYATRARALVQALRRGDL